MGPGPVAAPAQLKGQVLSQTFTAEPPNCVTSLLHPTLILCWALCWQQGQGTRMAAAHRDKELPIHPAEHQEGAEDAPRRLERYREILRDTENFTLQLDGDKKATQPPTKSPFVSCSPRSHERVIAL